jgi:hypothetical protein
MKSLGAQAGAKLKSKHDKPMIPLERLLASLDVRSEMKKKLRNEKAGLNPFQLQRRLEDGLRAILHGALHFSRPTDSLHSAPHAGKNVVRWVS